MMIEIDESEGESHVFQKKKILGTKQFRVVWYLFLTRNRHF